MTVGYVHSLQSLGTLDGPGVRFVVFMQGCNLRCGCCHNPDTWDRAGGTAYTPLELVDKTERYRSYFGRDGGITLSGGEPLLQAAFARDLFRLCKERGINTCLDTSGSVLNDDVKVLLEYTDRVLLDIKYDTDSMYREHVGCGIDKPLEFLAYLGSKNIPVTIRQVTMPNLNDTEKSIAFLNELAVKHPCIDKIELLPFKKLCTVKYEKLGIDFKFADIPEPTREKMRELESKLKKI